MMCAVLAAGANSVAQTTGRVPDAVKAIPAASSRSDERWADAMLRRMTVEEKVGQMIEVRGIMRFYNAADPQMQQLIEDIRRYHLGAVHLTVDVDSAGLVRTEPYEAAMTANVLQKESHGKVPLIFSADYERGPSMRLSAVEYYPHAMAFGATHNPEYARRWGKIVADESRAMGIAWNFYPIADVQINPKNPIINTRSFGEDPNEVSAMVTAYIWGSHEGGMLTTLKHFPGHGDTDTDSHTSLSRVNAPLERLNSVELPPFKAGIKAGSDAVMIAHVAFPAIEPDPNKIATTSPKVVTGLLREQMGFKGVIVSDAMEMRGLTKVYPGDSRVAAGKAAVDTILAGQDLLELPSDLEGTYDGLLRAVKSGAISKSRLDASVRRLLLLKAKVGLNKPGSHLAAIDQLSQHVGTSDGYVLAQEVADHAATLVRDGSRLPVMRRGETGVLVLAFVSNTHHEDGRVLEREMLARVPGARVVFVDRSTAPLEVEAITAMAKDAKRVIAAVYSTPQPGQIGVAETSLEGISRRATTGVVLRNVLDAANDKTTVLAMGTPYTILGFADIKNYMCLYSSVAPSERAAVKALFGEIPIHGKLPVTLPDVARRGDGIDREAVK